MAVLSKVGEYVSPAILAELFAVRNIIEQQLYDDIKLHIEEGRSGVFMMSAPTGYGKTTYLPFLLARLSKVFLAQGTRYATGDAYKYLKSTNFQSGKVSDLVAMMMGSRMMDGGTVEGPAATAPVTMVTDGFLHAHAENFKKALNGAHVFIIDEVHTLDEPAQCLIQLLPGIMKDLEDQGYPLEVILVSATLDGKEFERVFDRKIKTYDYVEGGATTRFNITPHWLKEPVDGKRSPEDAVGMRKTHIVRILKEIYVEKKYDEPGVKYTDNSIIIFVGGKREIADTIKEIATKLPGLARYCHGLHGDMTREQQEGLAIMDEFKIIITTAIAETGFTIHHARFVIDGGIKKEMIFYNGLGESALTQIAVVQCITLQRMGRVGRLGDGHAFMLYTEEDHLTRARFAISSTILGDHREFLLYWLKQFPGTYPDQEDMNVYGVQMLIQPVRAVLAQAVRIMVSIGAVERSPSDPSPRGLRLTEAGLYAVTSPLGYRAALFWKLTKGTDSTKFVKLMAQWAVVLMLQDKKEYPIGRFDDEILNQNTGTWRMRDVRATAAEIATLGAQVGEFGDLLADLYDVQNMGGRRRHFSDYFQCNKKFTPKQRTEYQQLVNSLCFEHSRRHRHPNAEDQFNPREEIAFRTIQAFPDQLLLTYKITMKGEDIKYVQARKMCTKLRTNSDMQQSVNISMTCAFDFAPHLSVGSSLRDSAPDEPLFFIYRSISFTADGGTPTCSRIFNIPNHIVKRYNDEFWQGQFFQALKLSVPNDLHSSPEPVIPDDTDNTDNNALQFGELRQLISRTFHSSN